MTIPIALNQELRIIYEFFIGLYLVLREIWYFCCKVKIIFNAFYASYVTHAIMLQMFVLNYLWSDAVLIASYLINRTFSSALFGDIPFWRLCPRDTLFHLPSRVFSCVYYV